MPKRGKQSVYVLDRTQGNIVDYNKTKLIILNIVNGVIEEWTIIRRIYEVVRH
jgi:hypothetical protein